MDRKVAIAAAVVIILIIAAAAAIISASSDDDDDKKEINKQSSEARLQVYGNANNDDVLNNDDLEIVKDYVKNPDSWNPQTMRYVDVNADGKITQDDADLLQKILNKESCLMYYDQFWYGDVTVGHVHYPVTGTIGVEYYSTAYFLVALGLWDHVTYGDDRVLAKTDYPTSNLKLLGTFGEITADILKSIKDKDSSFSCLVAYGTGDYSKKAQEDLWAIENAGGSFVCDVIALDVQGVNIETMLTLGTLLGADKAAQDYANYYDRVNAYLKDSVSGLESSQYVKFYNIYDDGDVGKIETHTYCTSGKDAGRYYPDLENIMLIPSTNLEPSSTSLYVYHEADYFKDAPCVVITKTRWSSAYDYSTAYDTFTKDAKLLLEASDAYKNKMVFGVSYEVLTSIYAPSVLPLLAYYMYGGQHYDYNTCLGYLNEFYEKFTYPGYMSTDFTAHGGSVFTL